MFDNLQAAVQAADSTLGDMLELNLLLIELVHLPTVDRVMAQTCTHLHTAPSVISLRR
nr:hypothetical protein [Gammaproteobacteria bacterium]